MPISDRTRARREFTALYGSTTANIVKKIASNPNRTSADIADVVGVSMRSVATTRGNLTRGFYAPWVSLTASGEVTGVCEF